MAKETEKEEKIMDMKETAPVWLIDVKNNTAFCGIGAGGVQFANGQAIIHSERMARWFMEHDGYVVTRQ